jgi:hypothetical protein
VKCDGEKGIRKKKDDSTVPCSSVLWIINSCVFRRWNMSIQIRTKVEWINRVLNKFHTQRSTLRRLRKVYSRRASLVRIVMADDDAGVHARAPALGRIVVMQIRGLPILGGEGSEGGERRGRRGPNAVRGQGGWEKNGGGEGRRI